MNIVGVNGLKRSGKGTIGNHLVSEYGYIELSFAEKLKSTTLKYIGCTTTNEGDRETKQTFTTAHRNIIKAAMELGYSNNILYDFQERFLSEFSKYEVNSFESHSVYEMTYRQVLQIFGTNVCRYFKDDIWLSIISEIIDNNPENKYVITDIRFDNEARMVQDKNGTVLHIQRDSCMEDNHLSEKGVSHCYIDSYLDNNGDIQHLIGQVDAIMEMLCNGRSSSLQNS